MSGEVSKGITGKRLIVDLDQCTGCNSCAIACSFKKAGVYSSDIGCIALLKLEESGLDCPVFCQQCQEPRCVEACPRKAIYRRSESGLVEIDHSLCDACGTCLVACPYGAISAAPLGNSLGAAILKCDQCGGVPECVQWCDTKALKFVDATERQAVDAAGQNMLMAKKRYEIEHGLNLWRLRLHGQKIKDRRRKAI